MRRILFYAILSTAQDERNILHAMEIRKGDWVSHSLSGNCLLEHVVEGKIEGSIKVKGRRGTRRKQLLDT